MKNNNKKGFTLVELVIVVAVMAILVAVAIPTVSSITASARNSVNDSNALTIDSVIKLAQAENAKTGDGAGTIDADGVDTALTNAKLGIEDGSFVYTPNTGSVKSGSTTASGDMLIEFDLDATDTDDIVKVTQK